MDEVEQREAQVAVAPQPLRMRQAREHLAHRRRPPLQRGGVLNVRSLLGWLETRLAQNTFNYLEIA